MLTEGETVDALFHCVTSSGWVSDSLSCPMLFSHDGFYDRVYTKKEAKIQ